jgi:hypothetical protein
MPKLRLDANLLEKMHQKTGKDKQRLRERISRTTSRLGISTAAAQIVFAKELGIAVAAPLNRLGPEIREEVRGAQNGVARRAKSVTGNSHPPTRRARRTEAITGATIDALLQDPELRGRCKDLLRAARHFDRVIREATTVLDDRLKKKTGITNMNPENLVGKAINPDPAKAVLEISADKAEQDGIHSICKGIMLAFRNRAHHSLSEKLTREDALKFCGFVDTVLGIVGKAAIHTERI